MQNRTPRHGDVYRDEREQLCLFVRTELRGGTSPETGAGADEPEHLFVIAQPDLRAFATRWFRGGEPLPERLELIVNAGSERRIGELEAEVGQLQAERSALAAAMKVAVQALPMEVAAHLRKTYRETRDRLAAEAA